MTLKRKNEMSLGDKLDKVQQAVYRATMRQNPLDPEYPYHGYACHVYDDYVIIRLDEKFWQASYNISEGEVTLSDVGEWKEVQTAWVAAKMGIVEQTDDTIVMFGSPIKALGGGKVGGYLVRFTDENTPDLVGDFFNAKTDFDFDDGDKTTVYYNHGLDDTLKTRKLGTGTLKKDEHGVWVEAQLQMRDAYERWIYEMVESGKMGWSSGTLPNLVEVEAVGKSQWIKFWPLGKDASITPTPAAGLVATQAVTLKAWAESNTGQQALAQQVAGDATTSGATEQTTDAIQHTESMTKRLLLELELLAL